MNKTSRSVVTDYRLALRFEELRTRLAEPSAAEGLDKPLAFFASPSDRHLPLALINRTLRELISVPLADLQSVPGIGPKKLGSLFALLDRAVQQPRVGRELHAEPEDAKSHRTPAATSCDEQLLLLSEAEWEQWREGVRRHHLGREMLGRFAASLRRLPRTLWITRLDDYFESTLVQLRDRKSYGEKRVSAILEIFGSLHQLLLRVDEHSHLSVCLQPRFATNLEYWLAYRLQHAELPSRDEIDSAFVAPLVDQLGVDGGETHAELVRDRLNGNSRGIGHAARRLGLARGRAYELLGDAQTIMEVRWPEGGSLVKQLLDRLRREAETSEATLRLHAAAELFFRKLSQEAKHPPVSSQAEEPGQMFQAAVCCAT